MSTFFMGISNCRATTCAAQSGRSTVNWLMARRSAVGAASQIHRESIHGETGKGDPLCLRTTVNQITAKLEKAIRFGA